MLLGNIYASSILTGEFISNDNVFNILRGWLLLAEFKKCEHSWKLMNAVH